VLEILKAARSDVAEIYIDCACLETPSSNENKSVYPTLCYVKHNIFTTTAFKQSRRKWSTKVVDGREAGQ